MTNRQTMDETDIYDHLTGRDLANLLNRRRDKLVDRETRLLYIDCIEGLSQPSVEALNAIAEELDFIERYLFGDCG